jgi:general secretion pathway protein L
MLILKNALGLDLGTRSVKAVELQQALRGVEAVQLREMRREDADEALPDLLGRFVEQHGLATEHVVAALPGEHLSSRRLSFPFRERRKLAPAVPFAVEDQLPFDLDDVVIDWEITGGDRSRADVTAAIAPRREVSELLGVLEEAGCAPRILEAEGLVLGNLAAVFDLPGRRLLADLGHEKSTLCLLVDGQAVAARTFPLGGRLLTEAFAQDRSFSAEDAERAKCEEGVFLTSSGSAPPHTAKVLDRFAREVLRTLGAVEGVLGGAGLDEITLFGGTALLDRLDVFLAERTGVSTARLGLPREGSWQGLVAGGSPILFAPAIALAVRGTTQARTQMNFRQDEFAVRLDVGQMLRDFRSTGWLAAAAAALALVSFGTSAVLGSRQAAAIEAQVARLYSEAFPNQPVPSNTAGALRRQVLEAQERADFLGVYRGNLSALDLLGQLSTLVPLDLDIGLEELTIDPQTLRMRVQAKSFQAADRIGLEIAKFGPFERARIGAIETDARTGGKRFNVTISLKDPEERG